MTTQTFKPEDIHTIQKNWSRLWWAMLIQGIVAWGFGLYTLFNPAQTPDIVVKLLGLFIIVDGLIDIIAAVVERKHIARWGSQALSGLLVVIAGTAVIALAQLIAGLALAVLIYFVALGLFISGVYSIYAALRLRRQSGLDWMRLFIALLKLAFAFLLFTQTRATAVVMVWLIGIFLLLLGTILLFLAFRMHKMSRYIAPVLKNDVIEGQLVDGEVVASAPSTVKELPDRFDAA
ncbi:MAG: DUF308 domain-containing protein [Chloroflexi bacterium]|nr:DUF308 domain-containing protein [Chloroflexota bacterium]